MARSTRLARAGQVFKGYFLALQQAREGARAVAAAYDDHRHSTLSGSVAPPRQGAFRETSRNDDPAIGTLPAQMPLSQQIGGPLEGLYDGRFARSDDAGEALLAVPARHHPPMVAVPAGHPPLARKRMPPEEVLRHPGDRRPACVREGGCPPFAGGCGTWTWSRRG